MHQSEERLHLPGYVGEGRHDTSLKVVDRFRVVAPLKFVLTSRNQERLFGPEATLFRGSAPFCTELLTWEGKGRIPLCSNTRQTLQKLPLHSLLAISPLSYTVRIRPE